MTATQSSELPLHDGQLARGRDKWVGHLAMVLFAILIAGSFSFGHLAAPHLAPAALNSIRFVFGSIIMGVAVYVILGRLPRRPTSIGRLLILGALMATYFVLMFTALQITSPISTGAVFALTPFMSTAFGWLFLRHVSRSAVIASLLIAAAGSVWMIFRGDFNAITNFDLGRGELIFLFGAACHAAYTPLVKKFNSDMPVVEYTFWTLVAITFCLVVYGANDIVATQWMQLPAIAWWAIIYLSVFTTAMTFFLVQFASMRLHASKVMSYGYLTPGVIILIEGLLGHGWASISVALGALVTIAGLVFLALAPDG